MQDRARRPGTYGGGAAGGSRRLERLENGWSGWRTKKEKRLRVNGGRIRRLAPLRRGDEVKQGRERKMRVICWAADGRRINCEMRCMLVGWEEIGSLVMRGQACSRGFWRREVGWFF